MRKVPIFVKEAVPKQRPDHKAGGTLSPKHQAWKKRREAAANQAGPRVRLKAADDYHPELKGITTDNAEAPISHRSHGGIDAGHESESGPVDNPLPVRTASSNDGQPVRTASSTDGQSVEGKEDMHSILRTPLTRPVSSEEDDGKAYITRSEKIAIDAHTKLVKAGKKAIALHDLSRSFDSREFRKRVIEVLRTDPKHRTRAVIEGFLHMVDKFPFFHRYSKEQQRQLARVAQYNVRMSEEMLFRQEDQPDGLYIVLTGRCGIFKTQGDMRKLVAVAGAGDSVGDISQLDEKCRRSVTIQISSDKVEFMEFSKEDLDRLAAQWRVEEENDKTQFILTQIPVLNNVPYNVLENLSPYFEKLSIAKDTVVYRQQDESNAIFFVWEGRLQLLKRIDLIKHRPLPRSSALGSDPSLPGLGSRGGVDEMDWRSIPPKKQSRSAQIAMVGPGEYFGEVEVFNDLPRGSAVVAATDCVLLSLSRQALTDVMPQSFLGAVFRYSSMRVQWRNARLLLLLDNLARLSWIPERDPKVSLEPELKPLAKMRSVLLPMLAHPGAEARIWLGAHTVLADDDAREWGLYHHGGWARGPDKTERARDERDSAGGPRRLSREKTSEESERQLSQPGGDSGQVPQSSLVQMLRARKAELLGASYFCTGEMKVSTAAMGDG